MGDMVGLGGTGLSAEGGRRHEGSVDPETQHPIDPVLGGSRPGSDWKERWEPGSDV